MFALYQGGARVSKIHMQANQYFSKLVPFLEKIQPFLPLLITKNFAKGSKIFALPLLVPLLISLKKGGLSKIGKLSLVFTLYEIFKILKSKKPNMPK